MQTVRKIVIIGPESTGKSTLCEKLAAYYNTLWVPEYAREFLESHGPGYQYDDLLTIAKGQITSEQAIYDQLSQEKSGKIGDKDFLKPLFIDTDLYVMKVWAEYVFNDCQNWILNRIAERSCDLYLLCDIDLPWVQDPLREHPDARVRDRLLRYYEDLLINQPVPWIYISGNYQQRFEKALAAVEKVLHEESL